MRATTRRALLARLACVAAVGAQEAMAAVLADTREPQRTDAMNPPEPLPVELQCTLTLSVQRLHVAYRIANLSAQELFVLDVMFRLQGRPVIDHSLAYTLIDGDRLSLMRGVAPVPPGMQVEAPELPLARRLPAHGALEGVIDAALPLRFQHPYLPAPKQDAGPIRQTQRVSLRIGWVRASDVSLPAAASPVAGIELFRLAYRQVIVAQRFVESADQPAQIIVRVAP